MISLLIKLFASDSSLTAAQKRSRYGFICGGVGMLLNMLLFFSKLAVGMLSGSVSITADAFNNLSDAGSSAVTLFGFVWAERKADKEHPFGHGRIEYISGFVISAAIVLVGAELLSSSVKRILNPEKFVFNRYVVVVLALSIAVKLYMAVYNTSCGKKINSPSLGAAASDSLSDCIATGAVLLSSVFMYFTNVQIDGFVGAAVSALIIRTGIKSLMETASPLLGNAPDTELVEKIEAVVRENPETIGIHDLVVHDYGPNKIFVSLHMEVDGSKNLFLLHDAVDLAEREISQQLGCEAVIHMDPIDLSNPVRQELYEKISAAAARIAPEISIHDFRMVPGPTHTNLIFDLVLPPTQYQFQKETVRKLREEIRKIDRSYFAIIKTEISYC